MTGGFAPAITQDIGAARHSERSVSRTRTNGERGQTGVGNQAWLRRSSALAAREDDVIRRKVATPSSTDAAEVAGHMNKFCAGSAVTSGSDVTPAPGTCTTNTGPGCECACVAMQDATRTFNISPVPCDVKMTTETMAGGGTATIPESSIWPTTSGKPCGTPVQINIPKAGSAMEFGAFGPTGTGFWYPTWRILAHELCGHGVQCQTYAGGTGDRPQHDQTIDTENLIAGAPVRGHYKDVPRQGESFANKVGDRSKVAFVLKDGWHYEAP